MKLKTIKSTVQFHQHMHTGPLKWLVSSICYAFCVQTMHIQQHFSSKFICKHTLFNKDNHWVSIKPVSF